MATLVLRSFDELAKVFGVNGKATQTSKARAERILRDSPFNDVKAAVGQHAAIVWAWLQNQESCKRYGPKGYILNTVDDIALAVGYRKEEIIGICIKLATNGLARITPDEKVRAA